MKRLLLLILLCGATLRAQSPEENLEILIKVTREQIFAISTAILPKDGATLEELLKTYGKPKMMYLPNPDGIRPLEFDLTVHGEDRGLKTSMNATLKVFFREDRVVTSYITIPHIDRRDTKVTRDQIGKEADTLHSKYNLDLRLLEYLKKVKEAYDKRTGV